MSKCSVHTSTIQFREVTVISLGPHFACKTDSHSRWRGTQGCWVAGCVLSREARSSHSEAAAAVPSLLLVSFAAGSAGTTFEFFAFAGDGGPQPPRQTARQWGRAGTGAAPTPPSSASPAAAAPRPSRPSLVPNICWNICAAALSSTGSASSRARRGGGRGCVRCVSSRRQLRVRSGRSRTSICGLCRRAERFARRVCSLLSCAIGIRLRRPKPPATPGVHCACCPNSAAPRNTAPGRCHGNC